MDDVRLLFGITPEDWARTPESVQVAYRTLVEVVSQLDARVTTLEAQLRQTSRNSSKPPSSDPPSAPPPPARTPRGRKAGAQPAHPDQQRPVVPQDQVDELVVVRPTRCPTCQISLAPDLPLSGPIWYSQVWEVPPIQAVVTEYQQMTVCCPCCQQLVTGALPEDSPPGAFGPRAIALVGLLHGRYRLSARETGAVLTEVCGLPLSLGSVITSCQRMSVALAPVDAAIHATVQSAPHVWVDETSWREQTRRSWLWVAVAPQATSFRIDPSRSQAARQRLLGTTYGGVVHSDRAHAYGDLPVRHRQVCWAHLTRNLQGLVDQQHAERWVAHRLLTQTHAMFAAWHAFRSDWFDHPALQQALLPVRTAMRELLLIGQDRPWSRLRELCRHLLTCWDALWTFSRVMGIEPTNNRAERALRPAVLWRKSCFGTQSADGSRFVERMLSVIATCRQQARPLLPFLVDTLRAAWRGHTPPTLVPTP